jgi:hypothetical protein
VRKQATIAASRSKGFWETARTLVYAVAIALGPTFCTPFNIPQSMKDLLVGDYLSAKLPMAGQPALCRSACR